MDTIRCTQLTVGIAGITRVATYLLHLHPEQPLVHLDAVRESSPFVEGIERKLFNERYPIHQDVVALGAKLNTLHFLAPHYGPHVRLVHAHNPVRDTLAGISTTEVVVLLAVHCRDDRYRLVLSLSEKRLDSGCSRSIFRISFSIFPSRSSSLRVIFLVWLFVCLRSFRYVRFAFSTSRNFVRGR